MEAAISEGDDGWRGAREASSSHAASPRLREVVAEFGGRGSIRSLFFDFFLYSYFLSITLMYCFIYVILFVYLSILFSISTGEEVPCLICSP